MILVVGTTGGIIARRLLEQGKEVRILVRKNSPSAVDKPQGRNQYLALGGPQPLSWHDVVASYVQALDRELPVNWMWLGELVPGLPESMSVLLAAQETYDSDVPMKETATAYGGQPTSLEEFVRRQIAA
jgi:nucleoside-diphosphate-sugar epimerase